MASQVAKGYLLQVFHPPGAFCVWLQHVFVSRGLLKGCFLHVANKGSPLQPLLVTLRVPLVLAFNCFCVSWVAKGSFLEPDVASRVAKGCLLQPRLVTLGVPFVLVSKCFCVSWEGRFYSPTWRCGSPGAFSVGFQMCLCLAGC